MGTVLKILLLAAILLSAQADAQNMTLMGVGAPSSGGGGNCLLISGTTTNCLLISGTTVNSLLVR
jgi:hypothetical protein